MNRLFWIVVFGVYIAAVMMGIALMYFCEPPDPFNYFWATAFGFPWSLAATLLPSASAEHGWFWGKALLAAAGILNAALLSRVIPKAAPRTK